MIQVRITGLNAALNRLALSTERTKKAHAVGLTEVALAVRNLAVQEIQGGRKSGATYGDHQASAPGEAPASDTGNLASSIAVVKAEPGETARAIVRVKAEYGWYLEYGTSRPSDNGTDQGKDRRISIVEPRPFMEPSVRSVMPWANAMIQKRIMAAMRGEEGGDE